MSLHKESEKNAWRVAGIAQEDPLILFVDESVKVYISQILTFWKLIRGKSKLLILID